MQRLLDSNILSENVPGHSPYLDIAKGIGIFFDDELKILKGVLDDYELDKDGYILFDERRDGIIVGFVIFGRIPITAFGWDIYWLVVNKGYQGKGVGKNLLSRVEQYISERQAKAYVRIETSTRKEYSHARSLYTKLGYNEVARIHDFYDHGDDSIIFYKPIHR